MDWRMGERRKPGSWEAGKIREWESVWTWIYGIIGLPGFKNNMAAGYFYFSSCPFV
jgi:hypothetical protein